MKKIADNLIWIIGQGGLLGSALVEQLPLTQKSWIRWQAPLKFSWKIPSLLSQEFSLAIKNFYIESQNYSSWTIVWAAGAGVIGTQGSDLAAETNNFRHFIELLMQDFGVNLNQGTFFMSSSAGGVWGGAKSFPIHETTPTSFISDYGKQKLAQEAILIELTEKYPDFKILIGRISNLYGPGQNLSKPQGLLSQLCRSALLQVSMNIFVPLNTIRDYLNSHDAADLILRALQKVQNHNYHSRVTFKIFCSEEDCSISQILNYLHQLTHHEPIISFPEAKTTLQQPTELTFRSQILIDTFRCRSLLQGINELLTYQETQFQLGALPFPEAV